MINIPRIASVEVLDQRWLSQFGVLVNSVHKGLDTLGFHVRIDAVAKVGDPPRIKHIHSAYKVTTERTSIISTITINNKKKCFNRTKKK